MLQPDCLCLNTESSLDLGPATEAHCAIIFSTIYWDDSNASQGWTEGLNKLKHLGLCLAHSKLFISVNKF